MMATSSDLSQSPKARIIMQQCLRAKLQVRPATDHVSAEFVEISRGLVVYICFLKDAGSDIVDKMVKAVLNARLSEGEDNKSVSIQDLPGDILIIPQATLGGRLKGKMMQYHSNIKKKKVPTVYSNFVQQCKGIIEDNPKCQEACTQVKWGTYGNRQVFEMDTNGPFTHVLEF